MRKKDDWNLVGELGGEVTHFLDKDLASVRGVPKQ